MADKTSTVVLDVDLECPKCNKKIRKALSKFYEIKSIIFDAKKKQVIVSGPFNPHCLINSLYCTLGCKIIKGHEIPPAPQPIRPPRKAVDKPKPDEKPKPADKPKAKEDLPLEPKTRPITDTASNGSQ